MAGSQATCEGLSRPDPLVCVRRWMMKTDFQSKLRPHCSQVYSFRGVGLAGAPSSGVGDKSGGSLQGLCLSLGMAPTSGEWPQRDSGPSCGVSCFGLCSQSICVSGCSSGRLAGVKRTFIWGLAQKDGGGTFGRREVQPDAGRPYWEPSGGLVHVGGVCRIGQGRQDGEGH